MLGGLGTPFGPYPPRFGSRGLEEMGAIPQRLRNPGVGIREDVVSGF